MKRDDQNTKTKKDSNSPLTRREFLALAGTGSIIIAFSGLLRLSENNNGFERPLTALPEDEFLALCTRCQKCIEVCPFTAITPVLLTESVISAGTPHQGDLTRPCTFGYMGCSGYCAMECPTGALHL